MISLKEFRICFFQMSTSSLSVRRANSLGLPSVLDPSDAFGWTGLHPLSLSKRL